MIPVYAKVLLGSYAKRMRDVIHEVQANETDEIVVHKLKGMPVVAHFEDNGNGRIVAISNFMDRN